MHKETKQNTGFTNLQLREFLRTHTLKLIFKKSITAKTVRLWDQDVKVISSFELEMAAFFLCLSIVVLWELVWKFLSYKGPDHYIWGNVNDLIWTQKPLWSIYLQKKLILSNRGLNLRFLKEPNLVYKIVRCPLNSG